MKRVTAISLAVLPFVVAFGLYATGALERLDFALDRHRWGPKPPQPGPTRPLKDYAGWWQRDGAPKFGAEWVSRVIVRTEGKRAWLRMWHFCGTKHCEQGEFEARVYGDPPDSVYALDVVRRKGQEVLWSVTLRPNGDNPNSLTILDDRRARHPDRNPLDNQSSFTSVRRVK